MYTTLLLYLGMKLGLNLRTHSSVAFQVNSNDMFGFTGMASFPALCFDDDAGPSAQQPGNALLPEPRMTERRLLLLSNN